jgi:hypothetical protein
MEEAEKIDRARV